MFYVLQNESTAALRRVPILLTDAATGTTAQTGVATTNIFPYVNINGNAFIGGTGNVGEAGYGQYYYEFEVNEIATLGLAGIHITAAGCRDYDAIAQVAAFNVYSSSVGATAGDIWTYASGRTITGGIADTVTTLTNRSGFAITGGTITTVSDKTGYSLSGSQTFNLTGDITGNLSGSVGSVSGAVGSVTGNVGGNVVGSVASVTADVSVNTASMTGIAGTVWSVASRTITGGIADTVQLVATPVEISYASMAGVANTIWSTNVSGYTNPSAGYDLTQAASGGLGLTAGDVWEYDISGILTAGSSGKQLNTAATPSGAGISAYDVWDFNITGFGGTNSAAVYVTDTNFVAGNIQTYVSTQTPQDVWTYAGIEGRTITGGLADTVTSLTNPANITTGSMTGIAGTVWSAATRTITGGTADTVTNGVIVSTNNDKTGYALSSTQTFDLTGNITGNLSGSVGSVTNPVTFESAQYAAIASSVWNAATRTLTSAGAGLTAGDVWDYAGGRTITGGIADTVTTVSGNVVGSVGSVVGNVSGSVNSVVSDVPVNEATISADVWGYVSRTLTSGAGISAGDVWSYPTRTVTGGAIDNANVSSIGLTALAGIAETVWRYQIVGALPLFNAGQAGYELEFVGAKVWGSEMSGYTTPTNFAGYLLNVAANGSTSNAPAEVWNYATRTLTSGAGATAGDVWSYATRTITGGIADTVTTLTNRSGFAITGGTITTVSDKTGYSLSSTQTFDLTGNITGNLSGSVGSVSGNVAGNVVGSVASVTNPVIFDSAQYASIASSVWNAGTRTLTSGGSGISAYDVWNFDPTAMTVPQAGAILTDIASDTNTIQTDISNIPNNVWVSDVSGYTNPGEAGFELTQAAAGAGLTAGDIWSYATRTITGGIANTVTNVTNGVSVTTNNDKTGYSLSSTQTFDLTGNITGNLSGSVGSVTNPVTFSSGQYAAIASSVWNAGTRTLTSGGSGISASDVWNYVLSDSNTAGDDLVTAAGGAGITAGDVWTYASRTITGGIADTVTTLTDRSGFAITGGTITTVSDKTGYSLSSTQSFNLTGNITGNLSGSVGSVSGGVTVTTNNDKTGYALSGAGVSAVQSGLSTLTTAQVGQEVDASLLDVGLTSTVTGRIDATVSSRLASASYVVPPTEAAIAGTVWGYSPRTLTSGAGATAGDVWNYPTRSLTSGAGITVSAATNIINGPYFVKSNVDGQDGNLDVIRGMVQDIQLTVTDAFQNPFDVTALGLAVNFYDQAGTLVTSYGTSNLYAPAGLVQFTLDTAVTGNEGRYNLILSAAGSGNTIKFGPLTTLVRPF